MVGYKDSSAHADGVHPHEDTGLIDLGSNVRGAQSHEMICALNLSVAVIMFNHSYAAIGQVLDQLIELCEKAVPLRPVETGFQERPIPCQQAD